MTFLFYTDLHLTGRNPPSRLDKFPLTLLAKLREVYRLADQMKPDFVVFGGDLFDSHRCYAYDILADAINIFRSAPCQTYMLIGQHDLIGYNDTSFGYSSAHFVAELSGGKLEVLRQPLEIQGVATIFPCHVFDKIQQVMESAGKSSSPCPIVVAHALVTEKKAVYETIVTSTLPDTGTKLVLCGDYHGGMPVHTCGGTTYYSPGAMARLKATSGEMTRRVKCAVVTIQGGGIIHIDEVPLISALSAEQVFARVEEEEVDKTGINIDPFIEKLEQLSCEATDIFQLLKMMAGSSPDTEVMGYINSFKKAEK